MSATRAAKLTLTRTSVRGLHLDVAATICSRSRANTRSGVLRVSTNDLARRSVDLTFARLSATRVAFPAQRPVERVVVGWLTMSIPKWCNSSPFSTSDVERVSVAGLGVLTLDARHVWRASVPS